MFKTTVFSLFFVLFTQAIALSASAVDGNKIVVTHTIISTLLLNGDNSDLSDRVGLIGYIEAKTTNCNSVLLLTNGSIRRELKFEDGDCSETLPDYGFEIKSIRGDIENGSLIIKHPNKSRPGFFLYSVYTYTNDGFDKKKVITEEFDLEEGFGHSIEVVSSSIIDDNYCVFVTVQDIRHIVDGNYVEILIYSLATNSLSRIKLAKEIPGVEYLLDTEVRDHDIWRRVRVSKSSNSGFENAQAFDISIKDDRWYASDTLDTLGNHYTYQVPAFDDQGENKEYFINYVVGEMANRNAILVLNRQEGLEQVASSRELVLEDVVWDEPCPDYVCTAGFFFMGSSGNIQHGVALIGQSYSSFMHSNGHGYLFVEYDEQDIVEKKLIARSSGSGPSYGYPVISILYAGLLSDKQALVLSKVWSADGSYVEIILYSHETKNVRTIKISEGENDGIDYLMSLWSESDKNNDINVFKNEREDEFTIQVPKLDYQKGLDSSEVYSFTVKFK